MSAHMFIKNVVWNDDFQHKLKIGLLIIDMPYNRAHQKYSINHIAYNTYVSFWRSRSKMIKSV